MARRPSHPDQSNLFGTPDAVEAKRGSSPSLWKSGLQKAVRRGDPRLATKCFRQLWADPVTRESMLRRLPIIAAEERWDAIADMVYAIAVGGRMLKKGVSEKSVADLILCVVLRLVARPKSKDADGVQNLANKLLARPSWKQPETTPERRLREALTDKKEVEATAWALRMVGSGRKSDVWKVLLEFAARNGLDCVRAVESLMVRFGQGALQGDLDMLLGGAVLAVCRMIDETAIPSGWEDTALPWYAADMHTGPGKMAMAAIIKRYGFAPKALNDLWFHMQSGVVVPENAEENTVWRAAQEADLREAGWTWGEAQVLWRELAPTVKELVEWALTKIK